MSSKPARPPMRPLEALSSRATLDSLKELDADGGADIHRLDRLSLEAGWTSRPATTSASAAAPSPVPVPAPEPEAAAQREPHDRTLKLSIPRYVDRQIARTCVEQECTRKYLVLNALRQVYGLDIDEADLLLDGRR